MSVPAAVTADAGLDVAITHAISLCFYNGS